MFRLKVKYRSRWKVTPIVYATREDAERTMMKLKSMGVQSKLMTALGEEVNE